jgi:hypothetical protein
MRIDNWHFEVIAVRCRKVDKYGDPYSAIVNLTVTDGELHIEGALSTVKSTKKDKLAMVKYIKSLGYDSFISSTFKDGKRIITRNNL